MRPGSVNSLADPSFHSFCCGYVAATTEQVNLIKFQADSPREYHRQYVHVLYA